MLASEVELEAPQQLSGFSTPIKFATRSQLAILEKYDQKVMNALNPSQKKQPYLKVDTSHALKNVISEHLAHGRSNSYVVVEEQNRQREIKHNAQIRDEAHRTISKFDKHKSG